MLKKLLNLFKKEEIKQKEILEEEAPYVPNIESRNRIINFSKGEVND